MDEEPEYAVITREEAKELGLKRYFTGKICHNAHIDERLTSNFTCCSCAKVIAARVYKKHSEKIKAKAKRYAQQNPDKITNSRRRKYANSRKESMDYSRLWYRDNRKKAQKTNQIYYQRNCELIKKNKHLSYMLNPDGAKIRAKNRRAKVRGAPGKFGSADIEFLLKVQKYKCVCCGDSVREKYHVDHILPLALGGDNYRKNLQILCAFCNLSKNAKHPIDFMQQNGFLL